jgi:teichuronic acid biosynthesis glycosyltransferase TuaG
MELISVITPYYKKKIFIKEAILSILKQTYSNFEIIIVYDDESLEDLKYVQEIVALDKRIHLIVNEKNIGAGLSRNLAIESSNGMYIAFLDSDDIWKENKIREQVDFMKKNNFEISHTSYEIIDNKKNIIGTRIAKNFNKVSDLLKSCDIGLSTVMIKKTVFSNECLFVNLKTKEDFVLWLKLLKQNHTIQGLDINLTHWRKLENSLSSSAIRKLIDGYNVYYTYMNFNFFKSIYYLFCLSINFLRK